MSAAYHFHQIKDPQPLKADFLKDRLKDDFVLVGDVGFFEDNTVRCFYVKPKLIKLEGDHEKEGIYFVWYRDYHYYTVEGLHFGSSSDYFSRFHQVVSMVAKKLNFVIDDPQYGLKNISPEIFASPKKVSQAFERKRFREDVQSRFRRFFKSQWIDLLSNYNHSFINDFITASLFMAILFITFAFKITLFVFLVLLLLFGFLNLGRRRVLAIVTYWLITSYYGYIIFNKSSISDQDLIDYSISGVGFLLLYGLIHFVYYGLRYRKAQRYLAIEIKELERSHFTEKDLRNLTGDDGYLDYLYTKLFTRAGIINFVIFLLLILGSVFLKGII